MNEIATSFSDIQFSVPLWQVTIFVIINSICLLIGTHKLGLLITYCFVFYWGFIFNLSNYVDIFKEDGWLPLYAIAGFLMAGLIVVGFFRDKH